MVCFFLSRHVGCKFRIHSLIHIILTGGTVWFGIYFRHFSCMIWWLSIHVVAAPLSICTCAVMGCFLFPSACLCVFYYICVSVCSVCVWGVGNRFERALSVCSVALWSSVAGCGLVYTGWQHTESGMEMILIKEIVGCLNLIRLSVPLTDVIVLIGSFVSFSFFILSRCDNGNVFFLSYFYLLHSLIVSWDHSVSISVLYYIMSVCLHLSICLSIRLTN